uniref:Uncharacterized protein n=1 Tax=Populus trichocarpa TaxID=3694 RepID=A0A3N7G133_POPTR
MITPILSSISFLAFFQGSDGTSHFFFFRLYMFLAFHSCYFKYRSPTFTQSVSTFLLSLLLHSCYASSLHFYPGSSSFCVFLLPQLFSLIHCARTVLPLFLSNISFHFACLASYSSVDL